MSNVRIASRVLFMYFVFLASHSTSSDLLLSLFSATTITPNPGQFIIS